jgi:hypothetical protein
MQLLLRLYFYGTENNKMVTMQNIFLHFHLMVMTDEGRPSTYLHIACEILFVSQQLQTFHQWEIRVYVQQM